MRQGLVVLAVVAGFVIGGAATTSASVDGPSATAASVTVPNVHCRRLDRAEDIVRSRGLRVRERGGGAFGILVKSNWFVSAQSPAAGTRVKRKSHVTLYAARSC